MNSLFSIRSLALAATAGLMFAAMPASAADAKVGFVSTDRVLRDSNPAKAAQKKLETEFASKEKELQEMVDRADSNGDGAVTLDDFFNIMTKKTFA